MDQLLAVRGMPWSVATFSDRLGLAAQAGGSHVPTAASYAVFGGVLASAVVAGLMVQMAVRSNSPERKEYPAHPLGFALALLTTSVLLFTALTARQPDAGAVVAFVVPICLLSAGGVLEDPQDIVPVEPAGHRSAD